MRQTPKVIRTPLLLRTPASSVFESASQSPPFQSEASYEFLSNRQNSIRNQLSSLSPDKQFQTPGIELLRQFEKVSGQLAKMKNQRDKPHRQTSSKIGNIGAMYFITQLNLKGLFGVFNSSRKRIKMKKAT